MKEKCGYTPKRMEEIFLNGPVVDDFFCNKRFLEHMYQKHGRNKLKTFIDRQPFNKDEGMIRILGCIFSEN